MIIGYLDPWGHGHGGILLLSTEVFTPLRYNSFRFRIDARLIKGFGFT